MPEASSFHVAQVQASVFTPGLQFRTAQVLAYFVTSRWGRLLDGEPITQPLPQEVPGEIARLILPSSDGRARVQSGPARTDLFWIRSDLSSEFDLRERIASAAELLNDYLEAARATAGRLACVVTRVAFDLTPALSLARHFCQQQWLEGPLNRPSDFELHAHKRFSLAGRAEINSWFRCKTGNVQRGSAQQQPAAPVILVEQDFNTLSEEAASREYTPQEITQFFDDAPSALDQVLELYFPTSPRGPRS